MRLHHKRPCNECPWRTDSTQGWLGGHDPEYYADAVAENEIPACHNRDYGADDEETAFCVGALQCGRNAVINPHRAAGDAVTAGKIVGKNDEVFRHPGEFYEYHAERPWVPRILR